MVRLTSKKRNALPGKSFAGPDRSYPINNMSHARNAVARVSQFGTGDLKARVRAKVHKKFPGIAMKMDGGAVNARMDRRGRK